MLPNGVTLLVEENHAAPVVAIQVWVRVGSADERADEAGLAHLHEHMLFKGTARRGPGEIARTIEAGGGEINAWTSFDQTVYHLVLASQVVGDVREAEAVRLAQKLFAWPPGPFEAAPARPAEPHREVPLARLRKEPLKEGYLSIAWPSPPLVHEDVAALDALAIVLGHGEASRLHRAMKRGRLLCTEVQASCYTPVDPGLTIVGLTLQPANAREAVREALTQTYRLRSEDVSDEELGLACRLLESDAVYQRETVQGQARKLGFYQSSASGVEFEQRYLEQVARLTPVRLRDAAERWIDPSAAVLAALLPEQNAPSEGELLELLEEAARQRRPRAPSSSAAPEKRAPVRFAEHPKTGPLLREELPGGGVLLIKEERAVPLVALRAAWRGGPRAGGASNAGITMA